jgi:hypothetical protein
LNANVTIVNDAGESSRQSPTINHTDFRASTSNIQLARAAPHALPPMSIRAFSCFNGHWFRAPWRIRPLPGG